MLFHGSLQSSGLSRRRSRGQYSTGRVTNDRASRNALTFAIFMRLAACHHAIKLDFFCNI